jgi:type I phosphodiesterase/nucleotide pyrophosphatase
MPSPPDGSLDRSTNSSETPERRSLTRRAFLTGAAAIPPALLLGNALPAGAGAARSRAGGAGAPGACALPPEVLNRVKRGWDPQRSGQLLYVPHGWNYLDGFISHSTPWGYTQNVPMLWYGPGFVPAKGSRDTPVTSPDIAPTIARLVKFPFDAPDGSPMQEAILPNRPKPKLVVVLVWDAGGRYVLSLFPRATPHLQELVRKGVWYENASVGSNPSNTAPIHASIGTGAFPRTHGVVDNTIRFPDGSLAEPWSRGPGVLKVPTLADEYAKAKGSSARTALFGSLSWHLGMLGQGAALPGGVRHVAVLKSLHAPVQGNAWWALPDSLASYYRFPAYVNDLPPISAYTKQYADAVDGKLDGTWRGHSIQQALRGFHTPARVPFQTHAIKALIERERLGQHDEPDLLFLNYKIIDEIGHEYYADSPEEGDTVRVQDEFLQVLVDYLDKRFPRQWVLCLTADHGHTASPGRTGAAALLEPTIHRLLQRRFDTPAGHPPLVQIARPTWVNLNPDRVAAGVPFDAMSQYVSNLTVSQIADPSTIAPGQGPTRAFDAVFAGQLLQHLQCG